MPRRAAFARCDSGRSLAVGRHVSCYRHPRRAPAGSGQPTFRTEANYVRVDVFPTPNGASARPTCRRTISRSSRTGAPQTIDAFEHVPIRGSVPQELRREPTSVAESRAMLRIRAPRVFVLFLDFYHVDVGVRQTPRKLVNALDRLIAPGRSVAVMTPEMSRTRSVVHPARPTTTGGMHREVLDWGERDQVTKRSPRTSNTGSAIRRSTTGTAGVRERSRRGGQR